MDKLIPFISKILAPFIVAVLAWAADKTGIITLNSAETLATATGLITWFLTEITHTLISKKTNPSNAASTQLAVVDKARNEEIKSEESIAAAKV